MKLDKTMFLVLAMITLFFIVLVGILARFGSKISTDPSFNMFFSWYVGLFMINLLNILGTLLFHFFLTDLPGERGLKGKPGEKGLEGEHDKCFCDDAENLGMAPSISSDIHSHGVIFGDKEDLSTSLIHKHNPTQNSEEGTIQNGGEDNHNHTASDDDVADADAGDGAGTGADAGADAGDAGDSANNNN